MSKRYAIVAAESTLTLRASSNLHAVTMHATDLEGWFDPPASGELRLRVDGLQSDNPLYDREGIRRLDAKVYPYISGRLTTRDEGGVSIGELTFHGQTVPVQGALHVGTIDDNTLLLTGEQVFDVRDWGVKPPRILMLKVHPDVLVSVRLVARR